MWMQNSELCFSWMLTLWFISLNVACITTKRNFIANAISFSFLILQSDVKNTRNLISDSHDYKFGT